MPERTISTFGDAITAGGRGGAQTIIGAAVSGGDLTLASNPLDNGMILVGAGMIVDETGATKKVGILTYGPLAHALTLPLDIAIAGAGTGTLQVTNDVVGVSAAAGTVFDRNTADGTPAVIHPITTGDAVGVGSYDATLSRQAALGVSETVRQSPFTSALRVLLDSAHAFEVGMNGGVAVNTTAAPTAGVFQVNALPILFTGHTDHVIEMEAFAVPALASSPSYTFPVQIGSQIFHAPLYAVQAGGTGPAVPTGLTATAISASEIDLAWTDNSTDETGFEIWRSPDNATYTLITTTPANQTTANNTSGLSPGTLYYYKVRAVNGSLASNYAGPVSATTSSSGSGATHQDTFDRTAANLTTASDGGTWSLKRGATWSTDGTKAQKPTQGGLTQNAAARDTGSGDGRVRVTFSTLFTRQHLIARYNDADNSFLCFTNDGGAAYKIFFWSGSAYTAQIGQTFTSTPTAGDVLELVLAGTSITGRVIRGGSNIEEKSGSFSTNSTQTQMGIGIEDTTAGYSAARWDDWARYSS